MIETLSRSWALLLGVMLLMVGNGIQGTLLGIRGTIENFSTFNMSLVMSAYFLGFLGGSYFAPKLIQRVGHVRVFAALGSFISAILIMFPTMTEPWVWIVLRVAMGFCFSGVYVTAESWLNNAASNENRGKALSLYMIVQMLGVVSAQGLLNLGDPSGFVLFIVPSVLVSIAFAPILLSVVPTPAYETAKAMSTLELFRLAPLSCVSSFLLGGVYSALFGMASVFGGQAGLTVPQISAFVAAIYVGGLILQFPIGYLSDRMDRRRLILMVVGIGIIGGMLGILQGGFYPLLVSAFIIGGAANPLYGLVIAYANDYLDHDDMASASGRLIFLNGVGAIGGPLLTGWMMGVFGPRGFFIFIVAIMATLLVYGIYRSFRRAAPAVQDTAAFAPITLSSTSIAVNAAVEYNPEYEDVADPDDEAEDEDIEEYQPLPDVGRS
ncbi:MFS transporter [Rhodobacteraceae bacterium SC52]|nr:MFS transporter [Rhodobacteraceae bacterium SC52]